VVLADCNAARFKSLKAESLVATVSLTGKDCNRHKAPVHAFNKSTMSRLTDCRMKLCLRINLLSRTAQVSLELALPEKSNSVTLGPSVRLFNLLLL
jgi:hypothetical protein